MAAWELVQALGVNAATTLAAFAAGELRHRVRACSLECGKLKHWASKLELLQSLPTAQRAEELMRANHLWDGNVQALSSANQLVEAYRRSSVFDVLRNSGRIESEMSDMRREVTSRYHLANGIHAGLVAVSSKHVHVRAAGQTAAGRE